MRAFSRSWRDTKVIEWAWLWLVAATVPLLVVGIATHAEGSLWYWRPRMLWDLLGYMGAALLSWAVLRRAWPRHAGLAWLGASLLYLVIGLGWRQCLAVALLVGGAWAAGHCALRGMARAFGDGAPAPSPTAALLLGLGIVVAVFGVLVHWPLNTRGLYAVLLLAPCAHGMWRASRAGWPAWRGWVTVADGAAKWPAAVVALAVGAGYLARFGFFPSVGYDDNALHLRLWTELTMQAQAAFDVQAQIWSVAPFAVDLLHAVASLLSGRDARGALNVALLAILLWQSVAIARLLGLTLRDRALVVLLFLSTPMLAHLMTVLQTELLLAVLATCGARLVLQPFERPEVGEGARVAQVHRWIGLLAVAALCVATKLPGAVLGVGLLAAAAVAGLPWRPGALRWPPRSAWLALLACLVLLAFVALHSYALAWQRTGNPLFPLYNGIFRSAAAPASDFVDTRYQTGFGLGSWLGTFFATQRHFEALAFTAGFQYFSLFPLAVAAALRQDRRRAWWALALPVLVFGVAMFAASQYWRYLFPVLPLATLSIGALLLLPHGRQAAVARAVLWTCMALNLWFLPGVSWFFRTPPQQSYTAAGQRNVVADLAPARALTEVLNAQATDGARPKLLYPEAHPYGALLRGEPVYVNWYAPANEAAWLRAGNAEAMAAFLTDKRITHVMSEPGTGVQQAALRAHLARFGEPMAQVGPLALYRLHAVPPPYQPLWSPPAAELGTWLAPAEPRVLARVPLAGARALRYQVRFRCKGDDVRGSAWMAQLNFDTGAPLYRPVPCAEGELAFDEAVAVPPGAQWVEPIVTVRGKAHISVADWQLGWR